VREWPPITEPELLERLAMDDGQFMAQMREVLSAMPPRPFQREIFERGLGYPFERPAGSYIWRDGDVELLEGVPAAERPRVVDAFVEDRHPILSFGANGSPTGLGVKFSHFPDARDREALVLTGYLHGVDVGAVASPGLIGYIPATLFASLGTAVRSAVVWATPAQVTQLAWAEITYRLGRLDDATFEMDEADMRVDDIFAFVARLGALCLDGSPVALAAVPAKDRTARAVTQEELLDAVARMVIGQDARAEDLVRATFEDMPGLVDRAAEVVWPSSQRLRSRWTPYPAERPVSRPSP
jgi:hypothetical protein